MLNICEIFHSLQGESTFAGLPCIFIRLAECNLRCSYCDTQYSHNLGERQSLEQIISTTKAYPCQLVEITGGEPLLQEEVIVLMQKLKDLGYQILLETNGSLSIQPVPDCVHIIMDVKLPGSGQKDSFYLPNLQWLKTGWDELKFVIKDRIDFDATIDFIRKNKLMSHTLLCSPVLPDLSPSELAEWIKSCGLPLRLNLQLHKIIWGANTPGV